MKGKVKPLSPVRPCVTAWTAAHQVPPSIGFSRQEYWSGVPSPSPGDLPDPGIEPQSPALQADALPSELPGRPTALVGVPSPAQVLYTQRLTRRHSPGDVYVRVYFMHEKRKAQRLWATEKYTLLGSLQSS